MIKIYNNETGSFLGSITEEELKFLIDELVEETSDDQDYYFSKDTIELLEEKGADSKLLALLKKALGNSEGVEIRWSRE